MSLPTDETSGSGGPEGRLDEDPQPDDGEGEGSASIGPSNLFEIEELAPDGGPLTAADESTEDEIVEEEEDGDEDLEEVEEQDEAPAVATTAAVDPDDDDEPPPDLVWYVLKVQSGREDTIRDALERRVKIQGLERFFNRIVVPTEKTTEIRNNKKRIVERKSYPGYIMVEMELNEKTWFVVRETPGVGDFVGAHGTPTKMTEAEVNQMLGQETAKTEEAPRVRIDVERGDRVKIKDGPFENFEGTVEEVIEARGLVKVMLIIFNRPTPVDLEYWQVERI